MNAAQGAHWQVRALGSAMQGSKGLLSQCGCKGWAGDALKKLGGKGVAVQGRSFYMSLFAELDGR